MLDCNDLFNALDITGDGQLNFEDIEEFVRQKKLLAQRPRQPRTSLVRDGVGADDIERVGVDVDGSAAESAIV